MDDGFVKELLLMEIFSASGSPLIFRGISFRNMEQNLQNHGPFTVYHGFFCWLEILFVDLSSWLAGWRDRNFIDSFGRS